jgi:predicted metal-dependent phosphoesterase TrpH
MGSVIFQRPPVKALKKEGFFGIDLHFHTKYSPDAVSGISTAIKKAQKKGFGFAITDHNTIRGVSAAHKLKNSSTPPLIIPGIEITCKNGNHILAYFYTAKELENFFNRQIQPKMKNNPFFADISSEDVLDFSDNYNCHICAPHPFAPGAVGVMQTGLSKTVEKKFDIVEVLNGFNFRRANLKAVYWATKLNKSISGGSDAHSTLELGKVLTFTRGNDIETVFSEIKKKKNIIFGREDNLFIKAAMGIGKQGAYVKRSKQKQLAKKLIMSQFGTEYKYLVEKLKDKKAYNSKRHK